MTMRDFPPIIGGEHEQEHPIVGRKEVMQTMIATIRKNRNPLAQWRANGGAIHRDPAAPPAKPVPMNAVAGALKVSLYTIKVWEGGAGMPGPENMRQLAQMMGIEVEQLTADWSRWRDSLKRSLVTA